MIIASRVKIYSFNIISLQREERAVASAVRLIKREGVSGCRVGLVYRGVTSAYGILHLLYFFKIIYMRVFQDSCCYINWSFCD